ncbi:MAG: D-alanyl-D-alanine carboxypeptidase family protein [Pseudomonadota bacterium]
MKKWMILGFILFLWVNQGYAKQVTHKKVPVAKKPSPTKGDGQKEAPYKAYMILESSTGKILEGENIHLRWPPASITKLMLSYIVMEKLQKGDLHLTDPIIVSREASKMGGSQVFLKEGEVFTLEELMKAIMVASANDGAYAVAEYAAGSKDSFVDLMNERARALNMLDTQFHTVNGLPPSKGGQADISSCYDLGILGRELLKYPRLLDWTSIQIDSFRNGSLAMKNHNRLLWSIPTADGLKTGYYRKAGYNVVATAQKDGLRLIVVVMGSPTYKMRDRIAEEAFKKYFGKYEMANIVNKGEVIDKEIVVSNGKTRAMKGIASESFSYPLPSNKKGAVRKEINLPDKIQAEVKAGQQLGEIVIRLGNEIIGKVGIISLEHIPKAGLFKKISERFTF